MSTAMAVSLSRLEEGIILAISARRSLEKDIFRCNPPF
jgi:hypothetical protein